MNVCHQSVRQENIRPINVPKNIEDHSDDSDAMTISYFSANWLCMLSLRFKRLRWCIIAIVSRTYKTDTPIDGRFLTLLSRLPLKKLN